MIRFYHFLNYVKHSSLSAIADDDAVICFDLEDSVSDILHPENDESLKSAHRAHIKMLLKNGNENRKIGIRVNAFHSESFSADLELLKDLNGKIHSIFLPKVNHPEILRSFCQLLDNNEIQCSELIPVIECREGMDRLPQLVKFSHTAIRGFAFGHCDYNRSLNIFPFFHQQHREYWSWIEYLHTILHEYSLTLIHSPLLQLEDTEIMKEMLDNLHAVAGQEFSQITLSRSQNQVCSYYHPDKLPHYRKYPDRHHLNNSIDDAIRLTTRFERHLHCSSFAIDGVSRELISPQEYAAARQIITQVKEPGMNFTFAGGCFPVQHNIRFEKRFHQLLQQKTESVNNTQLNTTIVRYELLRTCFDKIKRSVERNPPDVLVFCFRMEPLLRLTKCYYRFRNNTGVIDHSFQLLRYSSPVSERFDLLNTDPEITRSLRPASLLRRILADLNYLSGYLLGNFNIATLRYFSLMEETEKLCHAKGIRFIVLGPSVRSATPLEKRLSHRFAKKAERYCKHRDFVKSGPDTDDADLYLPGGVYVSEHYHRRVAEILFLKLGIVHENPPLLSLECTV